MWNNFWCLLFCDVSKLCTLHTPKEKEKYELEKGRYEMSDEWRPGTEVLHRYNLYTGYFSDFCTLKNEIHKKEKERERDR